MTLSHNDAVMRYALYAIIALTILVSAIVTYNIGLAKSDPSNRMRYHAIPVALSQMYHKHPWDYTANWSVAMQFHGPNKIQDVINLTKQIETSPNDRVYYWTADDRGLSDFVLAAFSMFGSKITSLFYFWYVLFGLSVFLAVLRFKNDTFALIVIACCVLAVAATLPAMTRAASANFHEASIHISESRMFDVLGSIAALHLLLSMLRPGLASRKRDVAFLLSQALFIAFLVHMRTSAAWLFIALIGVAAFIFVIQKLRQANFNRAIPAVVVCIGISWLSIHAYHALAFNEKYFGELGPRTFWHNMLMGLSGDPIFSKQLQIPHVGDRAAVETVLREMKKNNDPRLTEGWETQNILNSLGSHNPFDWATYEQVAKEIVLEALYENPQVAAEMFLIDRPWSAFHLISCRYFLILKICGITSGLENIDPRKTLTPLNWIWLSLLGLIIFVVLINNLMFSQGQKQHSQSSLVLLFSTLFIMSLLGLAPVVVMYSGVTQVGGSVVFFLTFMALLITLLCAEMAKLLFKAIMQDNKSKDLIIDMK